MNTNAIRDLAISARHQLMEGVERRCLLFDVREGAPVDSDTVGGRVLSARERSQRAELVRALAELSRGRKPGEGMAQLVERAAYTWFNRLFAIRFMEANDRLPSHVRMLSAPDGSFEPECLREAMDLPLDTLDAEEVARLVAAGDDEGLFRAILLAQCDALADSMPAVFERVGAAMGLLLPDGLLAPGGVVEALVTAVPEDDWREGVEIVGWAYQFYMSEVRAELQNVKVGRNQIGTATQLYTPEWIVRYLVDNSVGRLWALNNPSSQLVGQMEYYVADEEGNGSTDFLRVSSPEEITVIDPACGSGHILCYAFDLLARMYEERGYRRRDIPRLILERNLTGVEIDPRAGQLAAFSLAMKACEWDARFLRRGVTPRIVVLDAVELTQEDLDLLPHTLDATIVSREQKVLARLDEVGSLWAPTSEYLRAVRQVASDVERESGLFAGATMGRLRTVESYAEVLANSYAVVVANPPYRSSNKMDTWLSGWLKQHYPEEKSDLFAAFTWRMLGSRCDGGMAAIASSNSWMFLSGYEKARKKLLGRVGIATLVQLSVHGYEGIAAQVFAFICQNKQCPGYRGGYIRLNDFDHHSLQGPKTLEAIHNQDSFWFYRTDSDNFSKIPGSPIAYWASEAVLDAFATAKRIIDYAQPRQGLATGDNKRFIREWWEVSTENIGFGMESRDAALVSHRKWFPCNKGGGFRKWYGNNWLVLNWEYDGREMKSFEGSVIRNEGYYFRQGITWGSISSSDLSMRYSYHGAISESKGAMCFADNDDILTYLLALTNTSLSKSFFSVLSPTLDYHEGPMGKFPVILAEDDIVLPLSRKNIQISKRDWDTFETSWDFERHPLLPAERSVHPALLSDCWARWEQEAQVRFDQLKVNEEELNRIFARIYHMEGEVDIAVPNDKVSVRRADLGRDVRSLISYAVGCMLGRYSLDKPGLILANQGDGLPEYLAQVPAPTFMPDADGILPVTDDEYFEDDIVALFCQWLRAAYGEETLEENLRFVADALGGTGSPRRVIRKYFMDEFFRDHCK